jgi:hypothetical protein
MLSFRSSSVYFYYNFLKCLLSFYIIMLWPNHSGRTTTLYNKQLHSYTRSNLLPWYELTHWGGLCPPPPTSTPPPSAPPPPPWSSRSPVSLTRPPCRWDRVRSSRPPSATPPPPSPCCWPSPPSPPPPCSLQSPGTLALTGLFPRIRGKRNQTWKATMLALLPPPTLAASAA